MIIPQSVPNHLFELNNSLWSLSATQINWKTLDLTKVYIVSGSAFIDIDDPYGLMGNPFTVIIGDQVKAYTQEQCENISRQTGTPETIFIRSLEKSDKERYNLLLTVLTPINKELGACAHGFTGAIKILIECGILPSECEVNIHTTINTTAKIYISSNGSILLEFEKQEVKYLQVSSEAINNIFGVSVLSKEENLLIASVGSPKLIIEVTDSTFMTIQKNLSHLNYQALLELEDKEHMNGIHIFSRNLESKLPQKAIQVNAYLGRENVVDPATGVSSAAQISIDENVKENEEIHITQYTQKGPSAILKVTKKANNKILVGGTAAFFNHQII